jgi:hypothetical protein
MLIVGCLKTLMTPTTPLLSAGVISTMPGSFLRIKRTTPNSVELIGRTTPELDERKLQ